MLILGIDEVGRGSWAGPLVVGAVALSTSLEGLKDSKLLSPSKRQALNKTIRSVAAYVGLGWVAADELDRLGLRIALQLAARRAIGQYDGADQIIIDGNVNFLPEYSNTSTLIKADVTVPAVSAASIVAKVARDAYMIELDRLMPGYGFSSNVGYGTRQHQEALRRLGLSECHRKSFQPMKSMSSGTVFEVVH